MIVKCSLLLVFLVFYTVGKSIRHVEPAPQFLPVPDTFFLNETIGNITYYQSHIIYEDTITLSNKDLKLTYPFQLNNISDEYIRDAVISNASFTVGKMNNYIINTKTTSCHQFQRGRDRFIGEVIAVSALGVATYAAVRVSQHGDHLKKLDQLLDDLEKSQSTAITDLQKSVLINQINLQIYQILSFEKEDMLLFLSQIFHPYMMKPELFPDSIGLLIEKQAEGIPSFYNFEMNSCDPTEIRLTVNSYFGKNPLSLELIKVETLGWFNGNNYIEPYLNGLMVYHDSLYNNFDGSRCIHTITNANDDNIECLNDALWYNSRCNLHFYLTCAHENTTVSKNFVKWKELGKFHEIVTKASHFYIKKENDTKLYCSVPENGRFLMQLSQNEQIEIGPVVIHGKSNSETIFFIRESEISDVVDNANQQIQSNNNFTKYVNAKNDELHELVEEDNSNDGESWYVVAAIWCKNLGVSVYNFIKNNFVMTLIMGIATVMLIMFGYFTFLKCCCSKKFGK